MPGQVALTKLHFPGTAGARCRSYARGAVLATLRAGFLCLLGQLGLCVLPSLWERTGGRQGEAPSCAPFLSRGQCVSSGLAVRISVGSHREDRVCSAPYLPPHPGQATDSFPMDHGLECGVVCLGVVGTF